MDPQADFDLLAAGLRADMADITIWVATLSTKLAQALPGRTRLRRGGMFGQGRVEGVEADLAEWRFALRLERGQPIAERTHIVRGIALKTEQLDLDAWLDDLSAALAELAATSARERAAILRLLE
jgi:hypothetical protein